ncbi:MAG: hypothetical protein R3E32_19965 [Chitinophagales bacterium]
MTHSKTILTFFILLGIYSCGINSESELNNVKFSSEKWKVSDWREKGRMTDDIVENDLLIGKTKTEIVEMLGEPVQQTEDRFHYTVDIGIKYMYDTWLYWLSVDFDTIEHKVNQVWLAD